MAYTVYVDLIMLIRTHVHSCARLFENLRAFLCACVRAFVRSCVRAFVRVISTILLDSCISRELTD